MYLFFQNTWLSVKTSHLLLSQQTFFHNLVPSPLNKLSFLPGLRTWGCEDRAGSGVVGDQHHVCVRGRKY